MNVTTRPMTDDDIPLGMRLKEQAGWNQVADDWRRFLNMREAECVVGCCDGVNVATTVACNFVEATWLAMVLVDEAYRGRGVGTSLLRQVLANLDGQRVSTIRLDATAQGAPLYRRLGFVSQYNVVRYAGLATDAGGWSVDRVLVLGTATTDWDITLKLDRFATRTSRQNYLRLLASAMGGVVYVTDGLPTGFCLARQGSAAIQIGPCVAETDQAALELLSAQLRRYWGRHVYVDVPAEKVAVRSFLEGRGLAPQREFIRMCRGNQLREDMHWFVASSGPEFG